MLVHLIFKAGIGFHLGNMIHAAPCGTVQKRDAGNHECSLEYTASCHRLALERLICMMAWDGDNF